MIDTWQGLRSEYVKKWLVFSQYGIISLRQMESLQDLRIHSVKVCAPPNNQDTLFEITLSEAKTLSAIHKILTRSKNQMLLQNSNFLPLRAASSKVPLLKLKKRQTERFSGSCLLRFSRVSTFFSEKYPTVYNRLYELQRLFPSSDISNLNHIITKNQRLYSLGVEKTGVNTLFSLVCNDGDILVQTKRRTNSDLEATIRRIEKQINKASGLLLVPSRKILLQKSVSIKSFTVEVKEVLGLNYSGNYLRTLQKRLKLESSSISTGKSNLIYGYI